MHYQLWCTGTCKSCRTILSIKKQVCFSGMRSCHILLFHILSFNFVITVVFLKLNLFFFSAPALPALKITETNNDEEGYRSFIVQAHQPVTKSYYSSLNITCQPKELHVNLLSAQIKCEIKGIDKDKRLVNTYQLILWNSVNWVICRPNCFLGMFLPMFCLLNNILKFHV